MAFVALCPEFGASMLCVAPENADQRAPATLRTSSLKHQGKGVNHGKEFEYAELIETLDKAGELVTLNKPVDPKDPDGRFAL